MTATPLQIITDACLEIGLVAPSVVAGSSDSNIVRLLAMLNTEGRDLAKAREWTILIRTATVTTADGTAEYALPTDYSKLIRDTEWDRTNFRPLWGPLSPQEWEAIQSGSIGSSPPGRRYRIVRSASEASRKLVIDPTPTSVDTLAYEYVSNAWATAADGTTLKSVMTLDDDIALLHQDLLLRGTIVRFKRSVGLDYASEADEYNVMLGREMARDRPARALNLAGRATFRLLSEENYNPLSVGS